MAALSGTVWLVTSLVSLFTLGLGWLRPSYPGWRGWAVGHAALVLGLLVGFLRTEQTLLPSVLIGNGLVMTGMALFLSAFERFTGREPSSKVSGIHGLLIVTILLCLAVLTIFPSGTARFLLTSAYLLVMAWKLIRLIMGQFHQQPFLRKAYGLNLAVFGVVHLLTIPRLIMLAVGRHPEMMFGLNLPNILMYAAVLVMSVGGTFAFWILHEDRRRQELHALHNTLELLAYQDPLTQVLNRRGLWQAFEAKAQSKGYRPSVLVLLDINEFKEMNDQQGHAAGDQCLKRLAGVIREIAGPDDLIGRLGGDEFMVLLTGASETVSRQLTLLTDHLKEGGQGRLGFTVSFGHTTVEPWETLDEALHRADTLMYSSKAAHKEVVQARDGAGRGFSNEHSGEDPTPRYRKLIARRALRQES
ncbi:GGDEF domain-containing protein (plasmid) [Deinococcus sp. KNUC1210]|uniref:GGDEF domain-containing protein n=1 Tax=Deinococcus sp. KNUC1210 TaxID=2917691 RepID=UPI001EF07530|nr:GGDEF domain-containing protein [Deinococcus sp. KNUC1210]ULH17490.1 GGDEF domain-containing protein [Deinococcus sp. KNUC1210]